MKNNIYKIVFFCVMAAYAASAQERPLSLPNNIDDLIIDGNKEEVNPLNPEDFIPSQKGKLSLYNSLNLDAVRSRLQATLTRVPEGEEGQGHKNSPLLQQLTVNFQLIVNTKDRAPLIETISTVLSVLKPSENLGFELSDADLILSEIRCVYITEVAFDVNENLATIPQIKHEKFIDLFCHSAIVKEPDWEDNPIPIDPAGIFIIEQNNATTKLKTKTLDEIKIFLGSHRDNSFFERYEAAGDGMNILKIKYAANKVAIQAKFAEVLSHVTYLESQK